MAKKQKQTIESKEYNDLLKEVEAAKDHVRERALAAVTALFKTFFVAHPEIRAVGWTQYTPYFNDGEACVFSVGELRVSTRSEDFSKVSSFWDDEDDEDYGFTESPQDKGLDTALTKLARTISDEIFKAAFGDHALVIATPGGFHVNEYRHD
jgi:hypothetical protein